MKRMNEKLHTPKIEGVEMVFAPSLDGCRGSLKDCGCRYCYGCYYGAADSIHGYMESK